MSLDTMKFREAVLRSTRILDFAEGFIKPDRWPLLGRRRCAPLYGVVGGRGSNRGSTDGGSDSSIILKGAVRLNDDMAGGVW